MGDDADWLCPAAGIMTRVVVLLFIGGQRTEPVVETSPVIQVIPQPMSTTTRPHITSLDPFYFGSTIGCCAGEDVTINLGVVDVNGVRTFDHVRIHAHNVQ